MFESFEDYKDRGIVLVVLLSVISIAISGLWFGFIYFTLDSVQTAFESTDCVINDNSLIGSCQELFALSLYPFLNLKDILIWVSFFFIFALVLGMLALGYRSGQSPVLMGYFFVIVVAMTYLSIHISNIYRTLLENDIFRDMMVEFTVYNRVMLNFPWFVFIITVMATFLGIVNYQKSAVNKDTDELNY
jgi:hypothetical protein